MELTKFIMMKYSLHSKLIAYASFSCCFLSVKQKGEAQVIYVDIDPDIVVGDLGVLYPLDLDENGSMDFSFLHSSYTFYSPGFDSYRLRKILLAIDNDSMNALAGSYHYIGTFSGGYWEYYPYALSFNSKIDANSPWQPIGVEVQRMAQITIDSDDGYVHIAYFPNWYNTVISETIDHYLGVRFIDSDSFNHYGWIRCDVIDSGETLILKDYAYNSLHDVGLYAGELISSINEVSENNDIVIYTYSDELYIIIQDLIRPDANLNVYNINGALVFTSDLKNNFSTFDLHNLDGGYYLVEVENDTNRVVCKIFIS